MRRWGRNRGLGGLTLGGNAAWAVLAGVVFNLGNVLLVAAISITGMAVAFPVCIGLALVLGVGFSWWVEPNMIGWPPLAAGSLLLLVAMGMDAAAYRALKQGSVFSVRGVVIAVIGGLFMVGLPPCLQKSLVGRPPWTPTRRR